MGSDEESCNQHSPHRTHLPHLLQGYSPEVWPVGCLLTYVSVLDTGSIRALKVGFVGDRKELVQKGLSIGGQGGNVSWSHPPGCTNSNPEQVE